MSDERASARPPAEPPPTGAPLDPLGASPAVPHVEPSSPYRPLRAPGFHIGSWLRSLFRPHPDPASESTPPDAATDTPASGIAGPSRFTSEPLVGDSPEARIRAEESELPAFDAGPLVAADDPSLTRRVEDLEDQLLAREQDLRVIRGELEVMVRERGLEVSESPGHSAEDPTLGLDAPESEREQSDGEALVEPDTTPPPVRLAVDLPGLSAERALPEREAETERLAAALGVLRGEIEQTRARLEESERRAGEGQARAQALAGEAAEAARRSAAESAELRARIAEQEEALLAASTTARNLGEALREAEERGAKFAADSLAMARDRSVASQREMEDELAALREESARLARERTEVEAELQRLRAARDAAAQRAPAAGDADEAAADTRRGLEDEVTRLRARAARLDAERAGLEAENAGLREQAGIRNREKTELADQLERTQQALQAAEARVEQAGREAQAEIEEVLGGLDELRAEFERAERDLLGQLSVQTQQIRKLQSELGAREGDLESASAREKRHAEEHGRLRAELGAERAQSQKEIQSRIDRIASLQREKDSLSQALAERNALAQALDERLRERNESGRKLEAQLARTQAIAQERVQELKKAVAERDTDMAQLRGELETRNREIGEARSQLLAREQRGRDLDARLLAVQTEKDSRERELVALRSRLETQVAELRAGLEDREQRITFLQEQGNKTEARAIELEDRLQEANHRLETRTAEFRDAFAKKQEEAKRAADSLQAREQEFRRFAAELKERDRLRTGEMERLDAKVKEKDTQVNELLKLLETRTDAIHAAEAAKAKLAERGQALEARVRALEERAAAVEGRARGAEERVQALTAQAKGAMDRVQLLESELKEAQGRHAAAEQKGHEAGERLQQLERKYRGAEQAARGALERAEAGEAKLRAADERLETLAHESDERARRIAELENELSQVKLSRASDEDLRQALTERDTAESARARDSDLIQRLRETLAERERELATREEQAGRTEAARDELLAQLLTEREEHGLLRAQVEAASAERALRRSPLDSWPPLLRRAAFLLLALSLGAGAFLATRALAPRRLGVPASAAISGPPTAALPLAAEAQRDAARAFVEKWAATIQNRDWKGHLALHAASFIPAGLADRSDLEAQVIDTLQNAEWMAVEFERLEVRQATEGRLVASFPFELRTRGHLEFGRRELRLAPRGDSFEIVDDRWAAESR